MSLWFPIGAAMAVLGQAFLVCVLLPSGRAAYRRERIGFVAVMFLGCSFFLLTSVYPIFTTLFTEGASTWARSIAVVNVMSWLSAWLGTLFTVWTGLRRTTG